MLTASQICLLAAREAKGGTGMVQIAGQYLNLVLQDLVLNRNLKVNRVTQMLTVTAGTNGPFPLEGDYLRTYDMFYPLQTPNGMTQFLVPITMEQYDAEFKATQTANYPYEFATDLSSDVLVTPFSSTAVNFLQTNTVGGGYTSLPTIFFGGSGGAAASATLTCVGIGFIFTSGSGYTVGDLLTVSGGTFTVPTQILLTEVTAGSPNTFGVVTGGTYTAIPGIPSASLSPLAMDYTGAGNTISVTGGTGAGFHPTLIWGLGPAVITAGGSYPNGIAPAAFSFGGISGTLPPNVRGTYGTGLAPSGTGTAGNVYIYPQSNGTLSITHRYMKNQPDIVTPETSSTIPWFPYQDYLIKMTAARLMGVTGDDRQSTYIKECEEMLRPHLIMQGDEQQTVQAVRLDPRHFKSNRGLRPTKVNPY